MATISALQKARASYMPKLPKSLAKHGPFVKVEEGNATAPSADQAALKERFPNTYGLPMASITQAAGDGTSEPLKIGVILSGGQAPGGHNVIAGLYDAVKAVNSDSELYGFLGGPSGLVENKYCKLTGDIIDRYRNTGGFDIIGSGRTKLETEEQFDKVAATCREHGIHGVVVVGGDDSNTNACMLAEYFLANNIDIQVIGCPKTIDGDLKNEQIPIPFGFDTATKVYSELIGNILSDVNSAKKYWHFIRVMGRSASHIALETALQTQPNITIVSEEVEQEGTTLNDIVYQIADTVRRRAEDGKNFGVAIIPEGLIGFIPQINSLISELNELLANNEEQFKSLQSAEENCEFVSGKLSADAAEAFTSLPQDIQMQLLLDRDPHGNVQVSRIETEKLLSSMVDHQLKEWKDQGRFKGKFSPQHHFFGYEGRAAAPSNFDADYCYTLGYTAATLINARKTGYIAAVGNLTAPAPEWTAAGVPLTMMMNMERRHGGDKPVIERALVELDGKPFQQLKQNRESWKTEDDYVLPGPIQYFGPSEVCDRITETLRLEQQSG